MRLRCLRCDSRLVSDPHRAHWAHCPKCSPYWSEWALEYWVEKERREYAARAVSDTRGSPSRGGKRL